MHERSCENNPSVEKRNAPSLQIGRGGATGHFHQIAFSLNGAAQDWRYEFSQKENENVYASLHSVLMNDAK